MIYLKEYHQSMQQDIESFYNNCFGELGWGFEPHGRHSDILNIRDVYMKNGCMWCLYDDDRLIGTVAVRTIDVPGKTAEIKRLYILKDYHGKGYGRKLFEKAMSYCREKAFSRVCLDTRKDRDASLHLIREHGFQETEKYNDNEYAELFFELDLAPLRSGNYET